MQCKEWDDANSELFKESHDEAVHKNSYKSRLYELISASLTVGGLFWKGGIPMAMKRRWILPLGGLAVLALTLWGVWGVGTAGKMLPEKKPVAPVEVLPEKEEGTSMKYDAALHRRGKPLPDPFHAEAWAAGDKVLPPATAQGAAPAPQTVSLPAEGKAEKRRSTGVPVLKGIMSYQSDRRAILEVDGASAAVKEGERAGLWDVQDIQDKSVTLVSGESTLTLRLR